MSFSRAPALFVGLEDCQRIKRRTCSQGDPQRGGREQKLIAIQLPCTLDGSFEIQIIENAHPHRDERQAMKRVCDRRRKARRQDVIRTVASDEGYAAFFQEVCYVGVITGEAGIPPPRYFLSAPFPPARVQKDHVAGSHFDMLQLFQGFEVFPMDRSSRFKPSFWRGLAGQERRVEQEGTRHHAVSESRNVPF